MAMTYEQALTAYRAATTTALRQQYKAVLDAYNNYKTVSYDSLLTQYRAATDPAVRERLRLQLSGYQQAGLTATYKPTTGTTAVGGSTGGVTQAAPAPGIPYTAPTVLPVYDASGNRLPDPTSTVTPAPPAGAVSYGGAAGDVRTGNVPLGQNTGTTAAGRDPLGSPTTTAPLPNSTTNPTVTTAMTDAYEQIKKQLDEYGLGTLATFAWTEIVAGRSADEVARDLRNTPEFKQRFPAIEQRQKAGLPALSPGEYVAYEREASQRMRAAGIPKGFYDSTDDFTKLLSNNVSTAELADRIDAAKAATYGIPPEVQARLWSQFGLAPGSGALASYFLDPQRALPLLQRDLQAAKIGGAADRAGYGLSDPQAAQLALQGVSEDQAQQGFGNLARDRSLFNGLVGQNEETINQQTQLGAAFGGDAEAQRKIEDRRRQRQAQFQDGVGYAGTQKGLSGLGRADQQ